MIERKATTTVRPISGAMNLDAGSPDPKQAFFTAGFSLLSIFVAAIGALIFVWSVPQEYDARWSVIRVVGCATGIMVAFSAFTYAFIIGNVTVSLWQGYQRRLSDWHEIELEMYQRANGSETIRELSQLELTPDVASHVLITALAIQWRLQRGATYNHAPWSVRGLEEKVMLDGGSNAILLGELNGTKPEAMSSRLAQLGLVVGRKAGFEGNWTAQSFDDVFSRVASNWHKLR